MGCRRPSGPSSRTRPGRRELRSTRRPHRADPAPASSAAATRFFWRAGTTASATTSVRLWVHRPPGRSAAARGRRRAPPRRRRGRPPGRRREPGHRHAVGPLRLARNGELERDQLVTRRQDPQLGRPGQTADGHDHVQGTDMHDPDLINLPLRFCVRRGSVGATLLRGCDTASPSASQRARRRRRTTGRARGSGGTARRAWGTSPARS